ncbi:hypothetical protein [Bradyrhizobium macuxiense]|uniref:hypothetical protein n=1 Tax=Bradyrhizobium macuxiense TaxID=1755647 RepID=UPI000AE39DC3|nr:hypothetical protein [Bradyrhizobium macuxiense]
MVLLRLANGGNAKLSAEMLELAAMVLSFSAADQDRIDDDAFLRPGRRRSG